MHATTTHMALIPTPVLQTTYGPFQVTVLNPLSITLDSMDIYGAFVLKEGLISLSLHEIMRKK